MVKKTIAVPIEISRAALELILALALSSHAMAQAPRGIFVYSWNVAATSVPPPMCVRNYCPTTPAQELVNSLYIPGVDGVTLVFDWSLIEPLPGVYQWDLAKKVPLWNSNTAYVRGQAVSDSNNEIYIAITNVDAGMASQPAIPCRATCALNWVPIGKNASPNLLDQWIGVAAQTYKKVNLAIRSGGGDSGNATPCWLFLPGSLKCNYSGTKGSAAPLTLKASAHQGKGDCISAIIAAPWDNFTGQWDAMLAGLASHLKGTIVNSKREDDLVSMIRLTGINRTTDEFRLPEEILTSPGCSGNAVATWLAAKYDYNSLASAWTSIVTSFHKHFTGKYFNLPIIPVGTGTAAGGQFPFPEIGPNLCVYDPPVDLSTWTPPPPACLQSPTEPPMCTATGQTSCFDPNLQLIQSASQAFPGHFTLEFESLRGIGTSANPYVVDWVHNNPNTAAAFMTNVFTGKGAACTGGIKSPQPCYDWQDYLQLLETGIFLTSPAKQNSRAQYIEVYASDVNSFPQAIWQAHTELTDDTPPVVTASNTYTVTISGKYPLLFYTSHITVSGTMSDDPSGSGVNPATARYVGSASGPITLSANGTNSFTYSFSFDVKGIDPGNPYAGVKVSVDDYAGNTGSVTTQTQ